MAHDATETLIHVVRHGEVHNPRRLIYGCLPGFRLSAHGHRQVHDAAARLAATAAGIAAIYASPLERAVETAGVLADRLATAAPVTDARFLEVASALDGQPRLAVAAPRNWRHYRDPFRPSWCEPFASVSGRMIAGFRELAARHAGREVIVVSHQSPIWIARQALERGTRPPWLARVRVALASIHTLRFGAAGDYRGHRYWQP